MPARDLTIKKWLNGQGWDVSAHRFNFELCGRFASRVDGTEHTHSLEFEQEITDDNVGRVAAVTVMAWFMHRSAWTKIQN